MNSYAKDKAKEINAILTTEVIVKDPLEAKGYQQFQVLNLFLDTLVRKDPNIGIVSGIAKKWSVSEDQTIFTFTLSEKAFFHNSEKITAEDVVFSFGRHLNVGSGSAIVSYLKNAVDKIVIVDSQTVQFVLKGAYPPFLELIAMPGFGIISRKSTGKNIIGSGPYTFESDDIKKWCLKKVPSYQFSTSNISKYCFQIERDVDKTIHSLNTQDVNLAMGSPLEVALSKDLKSDFVSSPTFSLVTTHIILNHSNEYLKKLKNRALIADIAQFIKAEPGILTKFDDPLDTYLPRGIMPKSYYIPAHIPKKLPKIVGKEKLRIVFPYGIFLKESVEKIVSAYKHAGFDVTFINVKGKELLKPIAEGNFDLIFIPYQGVISDPDGYLDLLDPKSILSKAQLPTQDLLKELTSSRFLANKDERLKNYEKIFHKWEQSFSVIPFSQNSIPIVHNKEIKLPNLNFSFHLNLRELNITDEK
ncbi:MAG: ABC transporter substrate-binding protein [Bdellovibrio sp.]